MKNSFGLFCGQKGGVDVLHGSYNMFLMLSLMLKYPDCLWSCPLVSCMHTIRGSICMQVC